MNRRGSIVPERRSRRHGSRLPWLLLLGVAWAWMGFGSLVLGQGTNLTSAPTLPTGLTFSINGLPQPDDVDISIRIVTALTLLTLAPSILILTTSFPRIVIVFSLTRNAMGLTGAIPNQMVVGFSLILTFFIMRPVIRDIETTALTPYRASQITSGEALDRASTRMKAFMLRQTRTEQVEFFAGLSGMPPTEAKDLPLSVVVPAFILNELRTAFQMGFLIFLPFLLIDYVVAIILMSLGLMFLPPATISLPLKILLFVLVDGWALITRSLVTSFL